MLSIVTVPAETVFNVLLTSVKIPPDDSVYTNIPTVNESPLPVTNSLPAVGNPTCNSCATFKASSSTVLSINVPTISTAPVSTTFVKSTLTLYTSHLGLPDIITSVVQSFTSQL